YGEPVKVSQRAFSGPQRSLDAAGLLQRLRGRLDSVHPERAHPARQSDQAAGVPERGASGRFDRAAGGRELPGILPSRGNLRGIRTRDRDCAPGGYAGTTTAAQRGDAFGDVGAQSRRGWRARDGSQGQTPGAARGAVLAARGARRSEAREAAGGLAPRNGAAGMRKIRVGLAGAGYISEFHVAALRRLPHVELLGLFDVDAERAAQAASKFEIGAYPSLPAMRDAGVECIHVLTPPHTHAAVALEA